MDLNNASEQDIESSFSLYQQMIKIMEAVDHKKPVGACCGKNKKQHITKFIQDREKYINRMKEIKNRKIKPLWRGVLFASKISKHLNSETITDEESLQIINSNALTPIDRYFDLSDYLVKITQKNEDISVNSQASTQISQKIEINSQTRKENKAVFSDSDETLDVNKENNELTNEIKAEETKIDKPKSRRVRKSKNAKK